MNLIEKPKQGHIHLEDYEILTDGSLIGAVAIFDKEGNPK
jgi:ABC-type histidine transport system ATPase subunit